MSIAAANSSRGTSSSWATAGSPSSARSSRTGRTPAASKAFSRAAADAGLQPTVIAWDPPDGPVTIDGATAGWPTILAGPDAATGIFAANDFAAIDLLDVADSLGIRVPDDLSIVGFDDVDMARLRRINLTTVSQSREALVRLGVEALFGRIEGRIVGESTRDPRERVTQGAGFERPPALSLIGTLQDPCRGSPTGSRRAGIRPEDRPSCIDHRAPRARGVRIRTKAWDGFDDDPFRPGETEALASPCTISGPRRRRGPPVAGRTP